MAVVAVGTAAATMAGYQELENQPVECVCVCRGKYCIGLNPPPPRLTQEGVP